MNGLARQSGWLLSAIKSMLVYDPHWTHNKIERGKEEGTKGRKEGRRQWQSDPTLNERTNDRDLPPRGRKEGRKIFGMNALSAPEEKHVEAVPS